MLVAAALGLGVQDQASHTAGLLKEAERGPESMLGPPGEHTGLSAW